MKIMDNHDYRTKNKKFPELPDDFPNELLSEDWADKVHGQTLKRLNERGGMSITELLMNLKRIGLGEQINKRGYNYEPTQEDVNELMSFLNNKQVLQKP